MMKVLIVTLLALLPTIGNIDKRPTPLKKLNEGVVYYTHVSFLKANMSEEQKAQMASLPDSTTSEIRFSFRKNKGKSAVIPNENANASFAIAGAEIYFDLDKNNFVTTANLSQKDYAVKRELKQAGSIKLVSGSKQIANYTCKKAIITTENGDEIEVYYTSEIGYSHSPDFYSGLDGFVLEYKSKSHHYLAKRVEKTKVDAAELKIPETHQVIDQEQYNDLLQEFMSTSGSRVINLGEGKKKGKGKGN